MEMMIKEREPAFDFWIFSKMTSGNSTIVFISNQIAHKFKQAQNTSHPSKYMDDD